MTTFQKKRDFANILTKVISNTTYVTEENCGEIFLLNTGGAAGSFTGSSDGSVPVTLPAGAAFAFGYIGLPRRPFLIDATGTVIEVSMSL